MALSEGFDRCALYVSGFTQNREFRCAGPDYTSSVSRAASMTGCGTRSWICAVGVRSIMRLSSSGRGIVATRVHLLLAPVNAHEIQIGDDFTFAGPERFAEQRAVGRYDRGEAAARDRADLATRILHDLRLLMGVQPGRRVHDEGARLQGML